MASSFLKSTFMVSNWITAPEHRSHGLTLISFYPVGDLKNLSEGQRCVSPVTEIDGLDAVYYLEAYSAIKLGFQDPDARQVKKEHQIRYMSCHKF